MGDCLQQGQRFADAQGAGNGGTEMSKALTLAGWFWLGYAVVIVLLVLEMWK